MMETVFWKTLALYNLHTWWWQASMLAVSYVLLAFSGNSRRQKMHIAWNVWQVLLFAWVSMAYYGRYCAERSYADVMSVYWGVLVLIGCLQLRLHPVPGETPRHRILSWLLAAMPLLCALFSVARGLRFPEIAPLMMPGTIVCLALAGCVRYPFPSRTVLVLLLCHWSLVGVLKASRYGFPEDYLLAAAAVPALVSVMQVYFRKD